MAEKTIENGKVYLIWGVGTHLFKIGFTRGDVNYRKSVIQAYSPIPLIVQGEIAGTMRDEKDLHLEFQEFRQHGEWFEFPEEIVWPLLDYFGRQIPEGKIVKAD